MHKIIKIQFVVLLLGTVFAWTNFGLELNKWLKNKDCTGGCFIGEGTQNPFLSACFYGAVFFTISFILSAMIKMKSKETQR